MSSVTSIITAPVAASIASHAMTNTVTGRVHRTLDSVSVLQAGKAPTAKQVGHGNMHGDAVLCYLQQNYA